MNDGATLRAERSLDARGATPGRDRPSLAPGAEVNGRYRVEAVLGRGGMGVVYRAADALHPERRVAMKVVHGGGKMSESQLGLFKAEFKITAAFKHPNIAEVHDFEPMIGSDDYLFTMAFVDGRDLYAATRGAAPAEIVALVVQVLRALSYVHSRHIIHFDLKPANILVDARGGVKVLDFGLAGLSSGRSSAGLFGTPAYMAPEFFRAGAVADHRADLYSLGIVAYQLLCGRLPFEGASLFDFFTHHTSTPLRFPDGAAVPDWLKTIVARLTAKEPSDRYRSANAVIEALSAAGGTRYDLETEETRESYILSSRFVGRDRELASILRFIDQRTRAHGAARPAWFVSGQSGVGKSRLMREVRHHAQMSRVPFAEASCYEGGASEYAPIAEVVRFAARLADASGGAAVVARFAPMLARIEPGIAPGVGAAPATENPEAERLKLLDRTAEFLLAVASLAPYVIHVNDLQWARPGTVDLLAWLVQLVAQHESAGRAVRLAVIGSMRDDEIAGRPIAVLLAQLRETALEETALGPLTAAQVEELACSMLGVSALPGEFVERLTRETAGAPFFVEEVMRALVENGSVFLRDGAWAASRRILELEIPGSMTQVFLRRFAFLDEASRRVLELLASTARPIAPEVLEEVAALPRAQFHQALASLVQKRMASAEGAEYRTTHDRMRESVYQTLPQPERRAIHARFGQVIEARYASEVEEHVFELAHHFGLSADRDKGLAYSLRAGDKARLQYSNQIGIEFYERALELLGPGDADGAERARVSERLGDLYYLTGEYDRCPPRFQAALTRDGAPIARARVYRKLGQVYHAKGERRALFDTLWNAAELLGGRRPRSALGKWWTLVAALAGHAVDRFLPWLRRPAKSPAERERLRELSAIYLQLSYVYYFIDPLGGVFVALMALSAGERIGASAELCHSLSATNVLYALLTFYRRAEKFGRRALAMAIELGSAWHTGNAHALLAMTEMSQGRWRAAELALEKAVALFRDCGDIFELTAHESNLARCRFYQGRMRDAAAAIQESIDASERTGSKKHYRPAQLMMQGILATKLGRVQEGIAEIRRALELAEDPAAPNTFLQCQARMWLGAALLDSAGEPAQAVIELERARLLRETHGHITFELSQLYSLLARAEAAAVPGETPSARRTRRRRAGKRARKALRLASRSGQLLAPALLAAGLCDWESGKHDRARARFRRSIAVAETQGANFLLAQAHHLSAVCLAAGEAPDRASARERLREAERLYAECGMAAALPAAPDASSAPG